MSLYERTPAPGELVMDGIAVLPDYRDQGIGTQLLSRIVGKAGELGCANVRPDVIDSNPGARRLYERFGFEVVQEDSYSYLSELLGFGGSTKMEYRLDPD